MLYTSTFAGSEAPLSEGGVWQHNPSNAWQKVQKISGIATTGAPNADYDDSYAYLNGFGPDCTIQGTLFLDPSIGSCDHEIELLFRLADTASTARGYEVDFVYSAGSGQVQAVVARWSGTMGVFHIYSASAFADVVSGSILKANITGHIITAWADGVQLWTQDITADAQAAFDDGAPGIGFFRRPISLGGCDDAHPEYAGLTDVSIDDGVAPSEELDVRLAMSGIA